MNRVIKFRAWDGTRMHWLDYPWNEYWYNEIKGGQASLDNTNKSAGRLFAAGYLILMQFTGLHDKEGVEIYEYDLVKDSAFTWIVKFGTHYAGGIECYGWYLQHTEREDYNGPLSNADQNVIQVIGNIHQHPNLLTSENV